MFTNKNNNLIDSNSNSKLRNLYIKNSVYNKNKSKKQLYFVLGFFIITLISIVLIFQYFLTTTSVSITEYSSIVVKSNTFNKIISVESYNKTGDKLLKAVNVNGDSLDIGLSKLLKTSIDENILDEDFIKYNKIYSVKITSKSSSLKLPTFTEALNKSPYVVYVTKDGETILNIPKRYN